MVLTAAGFAGAAGAGAGASAAVAASAATSSSSSAAAVAVPVSAAAVAAASSQLRLQALASAAGTAIGTCVRIPTEVLKQRLQVGLYPNALDAARAARDAGGLPWSLFAGTGATLAREVPFYAAGMAAYEVLKTVADGSATSPTRTPSRELARWEMIALGELLFFFLSSFLSFFFHALFDAEETFSGKEKNSPSFFTFSFSFSFSFSFTLKTLSTEQGAAPGRSPRSSRRPPT